MKLHKLTRRGSAHIIIPLLFIVGFGVIGSYLLIRSRAAATPVSCSRSGSYGGHATYYCNFSVGTPVIAGGTTARKVGTFTGSRNWILCQAQSVRYTKSSNVYNSWWGYTLSDQGTWGWVSATYATTGGNDGAFGGGTPSCPTAHVTPSSSVPKIASGTGGGSTGGGTPAPGNSVGQNILYYAKTQLGRPYPAEGDGNWYGPTNGGFDCSGLVMYAVYQATHFKLNHYTGDQHGELASHPGVYTITSVSQLQPGDIIFTYSDYHHVGIYAGGGKEISAWNPGDSVKYTTLATQGGPFHVAYRMTR